MVQNNQINIPTPFAINKGGTGVTSVTTAPTASAWSGWDANKNASATGFIPGYTTTVTSASPVVLTVGSNQQQYFTGSTAQTLTMPVASTLVVGQNWTVVNNSSAVVTIQSSGSNTILSLPASSETVVTCVTASGTSAASWTTSPAVSGSGTVNSGLINQLAWYAASGTAVSGLTIVNSAGLITTSGGVPTWVAYTGTNAPVLGTAPTISAPLINQINDQTQNLSVVKFLSVASAVNQLTINNAATGGFPTLQSTGTDTDISLGFIAKGAGSIGFNGYGGATSLLNAAGVASAVNFLTTVNSATGNPIVLEPAGTDSNISMSLVSKGTGRVQIFGTSTNAAVVSGYVGELITSTVASASAVTSTANAASNVTSISLTAGDWDVWGNVTWITMGTVPTAVYAWTSSTTAALPDFNITNSITNTTGMAARIGIDAPYRRYLLSTTTTIFLSGQLSNTSGNGTFCGSIYARRAS